MRICAMTSCSNSSYSLEKWKFQECVKHGVKNGSSGCNCKAPFTLYPFPTEKKNPDGRREWIKIVNRKDVSTDKLWLPKSDDRICSVHFKDGEKSIEYPNPCINLGYKKDVKIRPAPKERTPFTLKTKKRKIEEHVHSTGIQLDESSEDRPISKWDHGNYIYECSCTENCTCVGCIEKEANIKSLSQENSYLKELLQEAADKKFKTVSSNCTKYLKTDSKVKSYTGLPNKKAFEDLYNMLQPKADKLRYWSGVKKSGERTRQFRGSPQKMGPKRKLDSREEMLLVLIKLRLGVNSILLSDMFGISVATVSSIFNTWIKFLSRELKPLIFWPDKESIQRELLTSLQCYKNLRCTIDCTEIFITRPRDREIQALTWSDYKRHNTVKFLIGIAPNGTISYVSNVWGGRASDRKITLDDGFIDLLENYDLILADRGFTIKEDLMIQKMATLEIPPPSSGLEQMTTDNVKKTKKIANARIHVERAIGRIKWFGILQNTLPITLVPLIDDIVTVCAALCNLLPKLV